MKFKSVGKTASILLSALLLSPSMAIAHLDGNGFSGCHQDSDTNARHCHNKTLDSSKDNPKSNFFQAFPFTVGGVVVGIFIIYLLYNAVMIVILIGRLIFFKISSLLKKH